MTRAYLLEFCKYVCTIFFVVTLVQCISTFSYNTSSKLNSSPELSKTSQAFFGVHHSHSSGASSKRNMFLAIEEEVEENEENTEKYNLPVLTFADLFHTLYFKERQNHYFIFQPIGSSTLSIPLHIKNCIYLI